MTTKTELKPCPCGASAESSAYQMGDEHFRMDCTRADCGWCVISPSRGDCIKDWNNRAPLKAPQVESEPVAMVVSKYGDPEAFGERELKVFADLSTIAYDTPLYLAPPEPQASVTVLPERKWEHITNYPAYSYNKALDEVAKLNATPVPLELLREICAPLDQAGGIDGVYAAIAKLRELIK